ncbi:MAG: hypothetical protein ACT4OK_16905 [Gemmobacter sp.]
MHAPYQRNLAHIATAPDSRKRGANTFLRSARQRRLAFEKEMHALVAAAARKHNAPTPEDLPPDVLADLTAAILAARMKWCGV